MDEDALDFAVAVWREEGTWQVDALPTRTADSLDAWSRAGRSRPATAACSGWCRWPRILPRGTRTRVRRTAILISDVAAADDWPLAREAVERMGVPMPEGEELDEVRPAGDLRIFEDLGTGRTSWPCSAATWSSTRTRCSRRSPPAPASATCSTRPSSRCPTDCPTPASAPIADRTAIVRQDVGHDRLARSSRTPRDGALAQARGPRRRRAADRRGGARAGRAVARPPAATAASSPPTPPPMPSSSRSGGRPGPGAVAAAAAARWRSPSSPARCAPAPCGWRASTGSSSAPRTPGSARPAPSGTCLADPRLNHRPEIVGGVLGRGVRAAEGFFADRR